MSEVKYMKEIFRESTAFDQMLNAWDVGKVTIMRDTFKQASVFNQALSSWQVGNVTDMSSAFNLASNFDQSIETWDVSKTTNMYSMFNRATVFNQSLAWDTSKVTSMALMFYEVRRGAGRQKSRLYRHLAPGGSGRRAASVPRCLVIVSSSATARFVDRHRFICLLICVYSFAGEFLQPGH